MSNRRWAGVLAVAVGAAALALPAGAAARTKTVEVGPFGKPPKGLPNADANAFFRRTITIHAGDRVRWVYNGFHTTTFAPKGAPAPSLIAPGAAISGVNDAAGQPFWFSAAGLPTLGFNPQVAVKQGGSTFDPSAVQGSGFPSPQRPKPYTLKFTRTGTFRYFCAVHPGMGGTVKVVSRRHPVPSARADRRAARRELGAVVRRARRLATGVGTPKGNVIQAGNDDRDGATIYGFFPAKKRIKVGTTLTLRMDRQSTEDHTFTFGPRSYLSPLARSFESPAPDQRAVYPSENPLTGTIPSFDGTNHGNGFFNSGVLDADSKTTPPPAVKVKFTKPGTYTYICLIHPFMRGTVVVRR